MKDIVFTASLPPIQSAISVDGQGNGARIKLDLPASEFESILRIQALSGKCFTITISDVKDPKRF